MCDTVKTKQSEMILINVTYENIKISYSFMVRYFVCGAIKWIKYFCVFFLRKLINLWHFVFLWIIGQSCQVQLHVDDKQF